MTRVRREMAALGLACAAWAAGAPAAAPGATPAREITLAEAIVQALAQNRDLALLALAAGSEELEVEKARDAFRPAVRPTASVEGGSDVSTAKYGVTLATATPWGTEARAGGELAGYDYADADDFHRGVALIELKQPLVRRLGPLVNREPLTRAESRLAAARRQVEIRKTDLVLQVVEGHENLHRLQAQLDRDREALDRAVAVYRLTQVREKQGRAARTDTLRADLRVNNARIRLNATSEQRESLARDFSELLGAPPETEWVAVPAPRVAVALTDPAAAVETALENRLDYAQILQDREDACRGVRIARRQLLPDLALISRYERVGEGATESAAANLDESVWLVGVALESELPRRRERAEAEQAALAERMAALRTESVRSAIGRQVRQAMTSCERAQAEVEIAERAHKLARENARLTRRLYEVGRIGHGTLDDAEDDWRESQVRWLSAEAEASIAACRLQRVLGTLLEAPADLKPRAAP